MKTLNTLAALAMLAVPALAYDITIKCDTQFPDVTLRDLPLIQAGAATVKSVAYQDGTVNTGIGSNDTAKLMIASTATNASFITATSTVTTVSSGTFTIPVNTSHTSTNGTFWYTILFYESGTGAPYWSGTGTCSIAASTAASGGTLNLTTPVDWDGYTFSTGAEGPAIGDGSTITWTTNANGQLVLVASSVAASNFVDNLFSADGEFLVGTGDGTYDAESGATARASMGVSIGSQVQAYDADLTTLAANNGANLTNLSGTAIASGTVADARIASTIARDSEVTTATQTLHTTISAEIDADITTHAADADAHGVWIAQASGTGTNLTLAPLTGAPTQITATGAGTAAYNQTYSDAGVDKNGENVYVGDSDATRYLFYVTIPAGSWCFDTGGYAITKRQDSDYWHASDIEGVYTEENLTGAPTVVATGVGPALTLSGNLESTGSINLDGDLSVAGMTITDSIGGIPVQTIGTTTSNTIWALYYNDKGRLALAKQGNFLGAQTFRSVMIGANQDSLTLQNATDIRNITNANTNHIPFSTGTYGADLWVEGNVQIGGQTNGTGGLLVGTNGAANNVWITNGYVNAATDVLVGGSSVALDSDLHTREHAMTGTSDHNATANSVFYSDGSGDVQEVTLGASGTYLKSQGTGSAPTWDTPTGSGGGNPYMHVGFGDWTWLAGTATDEAAGGAPTIESYTGSEGNYRYLKHVKEGSTLGEGHYTCSMIAPTTGVATVTFSVNVVDGAASEMTNSAYAYWRLDVYEGRDGLNTIYNGAANQAFAADSTNQVQTLTITNNNVDLYMLLQMGSQLTNSPCFGPMKWAW